jgi:nickel transport protein
MSKYNFKILRFIVLLIVIIGISTPAIAHKITIFAWVEGDTVYTQSKFSGGRKAKHAVVEVYDAKGDKLLEGKTDENGEFSFKLPKQKELKVVLLAGTGHRGEWSIPLEEIVGGDANPDSRLQSQAFQTKKEPSRHELPSISSADIQEAVEKALDKKLKPILNQLTESRQKKTETEITDIIGGIGYILGLVGIGAYFNYRKKKTKT